MLWAAAIPNPEPRALSRPPGQLEDLDTFGMLWWLVALAVVARCV